MKNEKERSQLWIHLYVGHLDLQHFVHTQAVALKSPLLFSGEKTHFKKVNIKRFVVTTNKSKYVNKGADIEPLFYY